MVLGGIDRFIRLSGLIRNYVEVCHGALIHHGGTEVTESFGFLPIGRRRWAKTNYPHGQMGPG